MITETVSTVASYFHFQLYYNVPLSHLRSKGTAKMHMHTYITYCTGSGMLTRYMRS